MIYLCIYVHGVIVFAHDYYLRPETLKYSVENSTLNNPTMKQFHPKKCPDVFFLFLKFCVTCSLTLVIICHYVYQLTD